MPDEEENLEPGSSAKSEEPDPVVKMLLHAALVSREARQWLADRDPATILGGRPGLGLLQTCLQAEFDPADEAGTRAFLAAQSLPDQSVLAALLLTKPPSDPAAIARGTLQNLRRKELDARREALTARLRQTGLSAEEVTTLQGEVVDIMRQLADAMRSQ